VDLLRDRGALVRLAGGVVFCREAMEEVKRGVAEHIRSRGPLSPSDLKTMFGMSRKYSIPLLEWMDETRFTVRRGDDRVLA
jgi:selenocysteine-specific elongation factor